MPNKKHLFDRPPPAPIFRPTLKEFEDPLDYIEKIRPVAQKFGICKIISPKQWNPPFAVDAHTFKFRPRVQRLNEIGAHSRMRNNFMRTLEAFWDCQNIPLTIPVIKNSSLDLFELHNKVKRYGGCHQVTKNKQWTHICREMGYGEKSKQLCSTIRSYFEKLIQPYLDFYDNIFINKNSDLFPERLVHHGLKTKTGVTVETPKMTRSKAAVVAAHGDKADADSAADRDLCRGCHSPCDRHGPATLICFECDEHFHLGCTEPPLSDVPRTGWVCSRCTQASCQQEIARLHAEVFGFSQSTCKYSLESFSNYADNFKKTYFGDRKSVSLKEVEDEYWRLVAAEDASDDVVVKYGADISSGLTSSGFPTRHNQHTLSEHDRKYVESGWNLNNLPVLKKSIFQFISNDISGMTVPWCYVGMVFSCFCWHIEDHWSYSINYLHTGECKTWYGVPESDADNFETLMRSEASELFDKSPDLLHHITTQINPGLLMKHDVKVYRTDQAAGEFVVTFPRAYHAGFNQGFNFAEAVNFCPADWLSKGRASVESYRAVKRPSVFSHNELICKMASSLDLLDLLLLKAVYEELLVIQQDEKAHRKQICALASTSHGPCRTERLQLDQMPEDDRECLVCRTTLYMSGVTCTACCRDQRAHRMACLDHLRAMCQCEPPGTQNVVLKYRYSLDEISALVNNVHKQLEQYKLWMSRVYHLAKSEFCSSPVTDEEGRVMKNVSAFIENLDIVRDGFSGKNVEEKPNLEELKMLLKIGRSMNIPVYLLDFLEAIIETCQRAMSMTDELLSSHRAIMKCENKENESGGAASQALQSPVKSESAASKSKKLAETAATAPPKLEPSHEQQAERLTLGEMRLLVEKLRSLPAHVPQLEEAAQTLHTINEWRMRVRQVVSGPEVTEEAVLGTLIESGESHLVYLSEYGMLHKMRHYTGWIGSARQLIKLSEQSTPLPSLEQFKKIRDEGVGLVNMIEIDRIATMTEPLELEDDDEQVDEYDESTDFRMMGWHTIIEQLKKNEKQLAKTIGDGEAMQKKADDILNSTPGVFALFSLNSLLKNADSDLKCSVPGIDRLKDVVKEAVLINEHINEMWHKLQQNSRLVHVDELQVLIKQADSLCVAFDRLADLKALHRSIDGWRKAVHALFIKQCHNPYLATPTLLEVLFPRPQRQFKLMIAREAVSSKLVADCKIESVAFSGTGDHGDHTVVKDEPESGGDDEQKPKLVSPPRNSRTKRGRQKRANLASDDPQVARLDNVAIFEAFLRNTHSGSSGSVTDLEFQSQYRNMCVNELEWMWNLRELNEDKASRDSSGHDFYCFCRKRGIDQKGAQVMCDLCQDWFHLSCLGLAHNQRDWSKRKFLCPQCERSRRPPFEVLLAEKRKLEQEARMVRVPEHAALCLMAQRVINFHKHTNQLFSPQTELGAAFAEYKRLFGVQAILPRYGTVATGASGHQDLHSPSVAPYGDCGATGIAPNVAATVATGSKQSRKTPHSMATKPSGAIGAGVSGMPTSLPTTTNSAAGTVTATQLSPVLAPTPSRETVVNINRLKASLSEDARRELEEIYIELCLLEVSQPTVTWVWKLYHSLIDSAGDGCSTDFGDGVAGDNSSSAGAGGGGGGGGGDAITGAGTMGSGTDGSGQHSTIDSAMHHHHHHLGAGTMASDDDDDDDTTQADRVHGNEDGRHQLQSSMALDMEYLRPYLSSNQSSQLVLPRSAGGRRGRLPQHGAVDNSNSGGNKDHDKQQQQQNRDSIHKFSFKRKLAAKEQQQQQHGAVTAAGQKKSGGSTRQATSQHQTAGKSGGAARKRGRGAGKVGSSTRGDSWERHKTAVGSSGGGAAASSVALSSEYYDMENDVILLDKVVRAQEMKTAKSAAAAAAAASKKSSKNAAAAAGLDVDGRHPTRQPRSATKYVSRFSLSDKSDYSDEIAPSHQSMEMKPVISSSAMSKRGRKPGSSSAASVQKESRADISSSASHNTSPKRRRRVPAHGNGKSSHGGAGNKRICNDDCSADMCVQQSSEKVNWVACDMCDKWFHWLCVDIKSEIEIEQRFLCPRCKSIKRQKRVAPTAFRLGHEGHGSHSAADKRHSPLTGDDEDELDGDDDLNVTLDDEVGPSTISTSVSQRHQDPVGKGPTSLHHQQQQHSSTSNAFSMNLSPPSMYLQSDCFVQEEVVEISYASRSDSDS